MNIKIRFSLVLFMIMTGILFGQNFKYGVTGNFHKGSIVNVHDISKGVYGGSLGGFAQWALIENDVFNSAYLYLQPEIEFNTQGEVAKANNEIQRYQNNYVSMAVYFRYFFHQGNMKRDMFLFAGPRIEYLVSNSKSTSLAYEAGYYKYNLDDKINKFGYGVSFGVGVAITRQWEAFMRYDRGFSKIYPNNPRNTYNRLLGVGINYYITNNW
ncbi:Outer membrane protein beta-barrel domain-containing protein [Halpernia humi]|uniref:Outer membrane protein beta-barrel domain-containing protein n=1 Tax=Halpernia humi TaxID=493375 RepID=A0A1H6AQ03_9FLAO|nr:outer membrane beta-barrel protein [Halpernia humi]SEG49856.1 Outer membrane protein beta-barrel domain-containing protein [Halpernia humi]